MKRKGKKEKPANAGSDSNLENQVLAELIAVLAPLELTQLQKTYLLTNLFLTPASSETTRAQALEVLRLVSEIVS